LRGALATKQSILLCGSMDCFASSGAHSRDPLARNDGVSCLKFEFDCHHAPPGRCIAPPMTGSSG
jgi:hypothetical protein